MRPFVDVVVPHYQNCCRLHRRSVIQPWMLKYGDMSRRASRLYRNTVREQNYRGVSTLSGGE